MPAPAQVGVRVVRVRRKQAELSKNARLRKRLQKLRESSRKLLGIHKVAPEPTFDDKLDALFARYDADHSGLIDADELVKLLEHFIPPHVRRGKRPGWPSLADAHFILGEVDIDGDEQTISRDELRAAVNLWRRLIAETTPSQSDQLKMHGRMGFCCAGCDGGSQARAGGRVRRVHGVAPGGSLHLRVRPPRQPRARRTAAAGAATTSARAGCSPDESSVSAPITIGRRRAGGVAGASSPPGAPVRRIWATLRP